MTHIRERNIKIVSDLNTRVRLQAIADGRSAKDIYRDAIAKYAKGKPKPADPKPDTVALKVDVDDKTWDAFLQRVTAEGTTVAEAICKSIDLPA